MACSSGLGYPWGRRWGRGLRWRHRLSLLKTGSTQNRPTLCWPEWNCCLHPTGRTFGSCFGSHPGATIGTFGLALFAALRVVLEILVVEEELLARGEDKIGAAINALKYLIREFHGRLPQTGNLLKSAMTSGCAGPVSLSLYVVGQRGPGPHKPWRLSSPPCIGRPRRCCTVTRRCGRVLRSRFTTPANI